MRARQLISGSALGPRAKNTLSENPPQRHHFDFSSFRLPAEPHVTHQWSSVLCAVNSEALRREPGGFVRATAAAAATSVRRRSRYASCIIQQLSRAALESVRQAAEILVEMALNGHVARKKGLKASTRLDNAAQDICSGYTRPQLPVSENNILYTDKN